MSIRSCASVVQAWHPQVGKSSLTLPCSSLTLFLFPPHWEPRKEEGSPWWKPNRSWINFPKLWNYRLQWDPTTQLAFSWEIFVGGIIPRFPTSPVKKKKYFHGAVWVLGGEKKAVPEGLDEAGPRRTSHLGNQMEKTCPLKCLCLFTDFQKSLPWGSFCHSIQHHSSHPEPFSL